MNDLINLIKTRRSIKNYLPTPVDAKLLQEIIDAGLYAPSGRNLQSSIILAVTNPDLVKRISQLNAKVMGSDSDPFYGAPVVLIVLGDKTLPNYLYDGSLVMENLMLAAHSLGLGSCWIHRAKEVFATPEGQAILKECGIKGDYEGIGNCIIGYPNETREAQPRNPRRVFYAK